jgi:hypothetical protein
METDNDIEKKPQFSYEEIPGRNQGVIYCHWPIPFKAYFFIRDLRHGRFLLLPEHKNERTSRLMEKMRSWFYLAYIQPRCEDQQDNSETNGVLVTGAG